MRGAGTKMKRYNADILIISLLAIFCLISISKSELNDNYILIIIEYLFMLFLPGYSIMAILFPRKNDLKAIKRLELSFIWSITIVLLSGIIFKYITSGGILTSTILYISIFTLFIQPISYLVRKDISESFSIGLTELFKSYKSSFNDKSQIDKIISIVLVIFIIFAISTTAYVIASPKDAEKYTEFYILGSNGMASNYPTNLTVGQTGNVTVGIVNHEHSTVNYEMIIKLNNYTINDTNITLSTNQTYSTPFTFTPYISGQNQNIEFLLYKLPDNKTVYRYLFLQIKVN